MDRGLEMPPKKGERRNVCSNRKARFEFELFDHFEAGLILVGSEVKSLRGGNAHLNEAWVGFEGPRLMLFSAHIAPYPQANVQNHEPTRARPLLLSHAELEKIRQRVRERGLTVVPLQMYFDGPWCKIEVAVGRGKKVHDKRATLREAEGKREVARAMRER